MPFVNSQGCRIYYRLEGLAGNPLLVLAHSLGTDHGMWDPQMHALLTRFQVLRLDLRGHGASDAPAGDYAMAQLGQDVLAAVDQARQRREGRAMTLDDVPMPSSDEVAREFVTWLEGRGAVFSFRRGDDWWLDLNGVSDMTKDEARELSAAAFDIRDQIRAVLMLRRAASVVIH